MQAMQFRQTAAGPGNRRQDSGAPGIRFPPAGPYQPPTPAPTGDTHSSRGAAMLTMLRRTVLAGVAAAALFAVAGDAQAGYHRQYYTSWSYYSTTRYYYRTYYYYPTTYATTYSYHYVIYYPSQPRYAYYYNPVSHQYWGRFEFGEDGKPKGYSLLAEEDRKEKLADIP